MGVRREMKDNFGNRRRGDLPWLPFRHSLRAGNAPDPILSPEEAGVKKTVSVCAPWSLEGNEGPGQGASKYKSVGRGAALERSRDKSSKTRRGEGKM